MKKRWLPCLLLLTCLSGCFVHIETTYELITDPKDIPRFEGIYYLAENGKTIPIHFSRIAEGTYEAKGNGEQHIYITSPLMGSYFLIQMFEPKKKEYSTVLAHLKNRTLFIPTTKNKTASKQLKAKLKSFKRKRTGADGLNPFFPKAQLKKFKDIIKKSMHLIEDGEPFLLTKKAAENKAREQRKEAQAQANQELQAAKDQKLSKDIHETMDFIQGYLDKVSFQPKKDPKTKEYILWQQSTQLVLKGKALHIIHKIQQKRHLTLGKEEKVSPKITRQTIIVPLAALSPKSTQTSPNTIHLFTRNRQRLIKTGESTTHTVAIKVKDGMEKRVAEAMKHLIRLYGGKDEKF